MGLFFKDKISDDEMERLLFRALCSLWEHDATSPPFDASRLMATIDRLLSVEKKKFGPSHQGDLRMVCTILAMQGGRDEANRLAQRAILAARSGNDQNYVAAVREFQVWLRSRGCKFGPPPSMDDLTKMLKD